MSRLWNTFFSVTGNQPCRPSHLAMSPNTLLPDPEESLSQVFSWETCSESSWNSTTSETIPEPPSHHIPYNIKNLKNFATTSSSLRARKAKQASKEDVVSHDHDNSLDSQLLLTSSRYIQGRPPLREDGNPKGKHPRKPLPWRLNKLINVSCCERDADDYRELAWREKRERERQQRKLERGETPDDKKTPNGFSGRPANMKKKQAQMTRRRKTERKRVNQSTRSVTSQKQQPAINSNTPSSIPTATNDKQKSAQQKTKQTAAAAAAERNSSLLKVEEFIKPHYLTTLEALAKLKGHTCYAYGCDYCEDRLRQLKTTRFKTWRAQAVINGFEDLEEHDHLEEMVRREIEKCKLEDEIGEQRRQQISMEDIVRWREEPGYVIRYRPGKRKLGGKTRPQAAKREVVLAIDGLGLPIDGRDQDSLSEGDWEDLAWDGSDGSESVWVEVWSDDGKIH